ncbi:MAG: hypothetical protein JRD89_09375 [Deltaproteobacteria bacterium]|nr:hypothetical protein [Deltaproteobacteria bacterium]
MFSTWKERHTFIIGFFEVLCPWPARTWLSGERLNELLSEYHYYMAGRGLGFISLLLILIGLAKLFKEVLL